MPTVYKLAGTIMLAILLVLLIPANMPTPNDGPKLYGYVTMVVRDASGSEVFSQIIHNQLVNTGESLILNNTFNDNSANDLVPDNLQIGSICISGRNSGFSVINETDTATTFNSTNFLGGNNNCKVDTSGADITTTQGTAVVAPPAFQADGVNIVNGQTILGIGVCTSGGTGSNSTNTSADMKDCHSAVRAVLFAEVNTSDVTLNTGETVTITYTFDIRSSTT